MMGREEGTPYLFEVTDTCLSVSKKHRTRLLANIYFWGEQGHDSRQLAASSEQNHFGKENMQNPPEGVPINSNGNEPLKTNNGARFSSNPPPRDYVLWSLFNFLYMNTCCLGLGALYFSIQARDRKVVGDVEGALGYGLKARRLNIATLCLSVVVFLIIIIIVLASRTSP